MGDGFTETFDVSHSEYAVKDTTTKEVSLSTATAGHTDHGLQRGLRRQLRPLMSTWLGLAA